MRCIDLALQELLKRNAKVYMACRNKDRAMQAIHELQETTGKTAEFGNKFGQAIELELEGRVFSISTQC